MVKRIVFAFVLLVGIGAATATHAAPDDGWPQCYPCRG